MWAVAKREYISFFKNPIGYFLLSIYGVLSAIVFSLFVLWKNTSYLGEYFGFYLIFVDIAVISVMAMRFFSEDKKLKTEQLLLTVPTSVPKLVMGRFIGAMLVFWTASLINLIYIVVVDIFGNLDYGALFTNFVGSILLTGTMMAIAIFISAVTESPIASAAGTLATLFGLMVIDFFAMFMPSWLGKILMKLTIYSYYDDFTNGILNLVPIVYYISITAVMLFLTVRMIEKRRWS